MADGIAVVIEPREVIYGDELKASRVRARAGDAADPDMWLCGEIAPLRKGAHDARGKHHHGDGAASEWWPVSSRFH